MIRSVIVQPSAGRVSPGDYCWREVAGSVGLECYRRRAMGGRAVGGMEALAASQDCIPRASIEYIRHVPNSHVRVKTCMSMGYETYGFLDGVFVGGDRISGYFRGVDTKDNVLCGFSDGWCGCRGYTGVFPPACARVQVLSTRSSE